MTAPLEQTQAVSLVETLTEIRGHCLAITDGSTPDLASLRAALSAARDLSEEENGLAFVNDALGGLALLTEVWECLASEASGSEHDIASFVAESLDLLAAALREGDPEDATAWILSSSRQRWGEYLALVDPSWCGEQSDIEPEGPPVGLVEEDDEPAIDASELLRKLTCGSGAVEMTVPDPEPQETPEGVAISTPDTLPVHRHEPPATTPSPPTASGIEEDLEAIDQARRLELDAELRAIFQADVNDLFQRIQDLVLALGSGGPDETTTLQELGRCLHTLKGASGSVGLTILARVVHEIEDRIEQVGGVPDEALIKRLEAVLATFETVIAVLEPHGENTTHVAGEVSTESSDQSLEIEPEATPETPDDSRGPSRAGSTPGEPDGLIRVSSDRFEDLLELASDLIARRRYWSEQAGRTRQFAEAARSCHQRLRASIERLDNTVQHALKGLDQDTHQRVTDPDDGFAALIRRLTEQADDLAALAATAGDTAIPMVDESQTLTRLSKQLWDTLQDVRIVPVRSLFQRLVRVAREAARVEGRQVQIRLIGEDTGADRPLLDRVFEPLLHVVRNAVGHGIEAPEERRRAGKAETGRITLEAGREGSTLVLSVQDDGRGLDQQAIAAKARRLGLLGEHDPASPETIQSLIFHPGFSTRSEANSISGRGVGMDVVAREVAQLRGRLDLKSRPGQGTRLTLRLPSRLSLEQVMLVRVSGQTFAIPIALVESIHHADEADLDTSHEPARARIGARDLRLVDLRSILGYSSLTRNPSPPLLIARPDGEPAVFLVDAIEGSHELVIKPLGSLLAGHPALSGTSLTMSGEVVLALDLAGVMRLLQGGGNQTSDVGPPESRGEPVLVVDDSLSVRRVATRHLRAMGLEVDEAVDGEQALGKLRDRVYRLILTDLEMPRMDGFELIAELSRTGVLKTTPVIATSTRIDQATRQRTLALGAVAFVAKPVSSSELARVVLPLLADTSSD